MSNFSQTLKMAALSLTVAAACLASRQVEAKTAYIKVSPTTGNIVSVEIQDKPDYTSLGNDNNVTAPDQSNGLVVLTLKDLSEQEATALLERSVTSINPLKVVPPASGRDGARYYYSAPNGILLFVLPVSNKDSSLGAVPSPAYNERHGQNYAINGPVYMRAINSREQEYLKRLDEKLQPFTVPSLTN